MFSRPGRARFTAARAARGLAAALAAGVAAAGGSAWAQSAAPQNVDAKNAGAQSAAPSAGAAAASAPVVSGAWIRGTVPGQHATGAFMSITSPRDVALVEARTPIAGTAQVHSMAMAGNVMKMEPVPRLEVPAGRTVVLKPGGYHVMLMDLKRPLQKGERVPITLVFEGPDRQRRVVDVLAEVRELGAASP